MGARVALEALLALANDPVFSTRDWKVDSVHLVGAGVGNDEIQTNRKYGRAVENAAGAVINYFSPKDDMLGHYFIVSERDRALGRKDIEQPKLAPANYSSHNVQEELPTVSRNGKVLAGRERGENHAGLLGTRDRNGALSDDGAMDVVAADIRRLNGQN